jgi:hypothetical protein
MVFVVIALVYPLLRHWRAQRPRQALPATEPNA